MTLDQARAVAGKIGRRAPSLLTFRGRRYNQLTTRSVGPCDSLKGLARGVNPTPGRAPLNAGRPIGRTMGMDLKSRPWAGENRCYRRSRPHV